jgi:hypothetical protein
MFEKAAADFLLALDDTSFVFVVPYLPSAPWFHFTRAYHVVHIHRKAKSARMFSRPRAGTFRPSALTHAGDEGGLGRVFIQECPFDFMVLFLTRGHRSEWMIMLQHTSVSVTTVQTHLQACLFRCEHRPPAVAVHTRDL